MSAEGLLVNQIYGVVFPKLDGWEVYEAYNWRIIFALSGDGRALMAFTHGKERIDPEAFLGDVASLVFSNWRSKRSGRGDSLIEYRVVGDGVEHLAYVSIQERREVVDPRAYCPELLGSVERLGGMVSTDPDVGEPVWVDYSVGYLLLFEKTLLEEEPSLLPRLLDVIFKARKIPSRLGFDVPLRKVEVSSVLGGYPAWSMLVPVTWDLLVNERGFSYIAGESFSVFAEASRVEDIGEFMKSLASGDMECSEDRRSGDSGSLTCYYEFGGRKRVEKVWWRLLRLSDSSGKEHLFYSKLTVLADIDILEAAGGLFERIASTWDVYRGAFQNELGLTPRQSSMPDADFLAPRPSPVDTNRILMEEARREMEHRRRLAEMFRETMSEIRQLRRDSVARERKYRESYVKTMTDILGKPWRSITPRMGLRRGTPRSRGISTVRTHRVKRSRKPDLGKFDWASGGGIFYIDQDGALRSRDFDEEVASCVDEEGGIYDGEGRRIGYIEDGYVYDNEGNRVGRLSENMSDSWQVERLEQMSSDADALFGRYSWGASSEEDEGEEEESLFTSEMYKKKEKDEED